MITCRGLYVHMRQTEDGEVPYTIGTITVTKGEDVTEYTAFLNENEDDDTLSLDLRIDKEQIATVEGEYQGGGITSFEIDGETLSIQPRVVLTRKELLEQLEKRLKTAVGQAAVDISARITALKKKDDRKMKPGTEYWGQVFNGGRRKAADASTLKRYLERE